jgi:rhomboid protease GluP
MPHCLACGRELAGEGELCPECQVRGAAAAPKPPSHELTVILIGINVLVFALMIVFGVSPIQPRVDQLLQWGASHGGYTLFLHQYWRLLTSNYIHIGLFHLLVNMYCLWGLGKLIEVFYSRKDYLLLYTYTGIAGSILSVWTHPGITSAGASGAVFGLAGVLLTTLKFGRLPIREEARKLLFREILQFAGINLVIGIFVLRVDNAGHLGGLLSGALVGAVLGRHLDASEESADSRKVRWLVLWALLVLAVWLVRQFWMWIVRAGQ